MTPTPSEVPSPLAEAVPESLDELFSRDPLKLQDSDLDKIIANLRAARQRWITAEASGAKSAPRAGAKPKPVPHDPTKPLDLEDLGL